MLAICCHVTCFLRKKTPKLGNGLWLDSHLAESTDGTPSRNDARITVMMMLMVICLRHE